MPGFPGIWRQGRTDRVSAFDRRAGILCHADRPQGGRRYWRSYTSVFWNGLPWASTPLTVRVSVFPSALTTV